MYIFCRRVSFYETDLMGVVHHSNYLKFFEEARVAWAVDRGLIQFEDPATAAQFAVLETKVQHKRALRFGDEFEIEVEAERRGARVAFQYRMKVRGELASLAETYHIPLDKDFKPMRLSEKSKNLLEGAKWTGIWLSNS